MAQVPYDPIPSVGMTDQPTPGLRVSGGAIEGASGENVGKAMSRLGAVLEHSGDELFKTAMMLQEQKNQAEANEGETKYSLGLTDIHTKFASTEGRSPSDNLMQYKDDVDKLRKNIREGLSNDAVRRLYDRNSLQSMQIAVRNGATHAAAQLKQYSKTQTAAQVDLAIRRAYDNPNDPLDSLLAHVDQTVRESSQAEGKWSQEEIELKVKKAQDAVIVGRIEGMNREKPVEAQKLLNAAIADGSVGGEVAGHLQDKITAKLIDVQGRNIADTVMSDPTIRTEKEALDRARSDAQEVSKDQRVIDSAVSKTEAKFNQRERVKRDGERRAWETVSEAIMADDVTTVDDLIKKPGVEQAITDLPASKRKTIQSTINNYIKARDKPINDAEMLAVIGMRGNPELKKEFLELDPTSLNLSQTQMKEVQAWQKADAKAMGDKNPKVRQAIQLIRDQFGAELRALGIHERVKGKNEAEYDRFEGRVRVFTDAWKEKTGHYPTEYDIVNTIGPTMLKQTMGLYKWGGYGPEVKTPEGGLMVRPGVKEKALVEQEVPKDWEEKFRNDVRRNKGIEIDAADVGRGYMRFLLEKAEQEGKLKFPTVDKTGKGNKQ